VGRNGLGVFDGATVFEIRRDSGGPKRMAANSLMEACGTRASLEHSKDVVPGHLPACKAPISAGYGAE